MLPNWVKSHRKARGLCECCGRHPIATTWAGTGEEVCWDCCGKKRAAYWAAR